MSGVVVVGDALLDRDLDGRAYRLSPDAPVPVVDEPTARTRPGGAALAAALLASDGRDVVLVTAIGADEAGDELRSLLRRAGVVLLDLGLRGATPEKTRVHAGGKVVVRLDRGVGGRAGRPSADVAEALAAAAAVLVADYGRGLTAHPAIRRLVRALPPRLPIVWDPHPRGTSPVPGCRLVTPNEAEAARFGGKAPEGVAGVTRRATRLVRRWKAGGVCVTMGARGALYVDGDGVPLVVPAPVAAKGDPCGAGDRFASAAAAALAEGALPTEAVARGVSSASAFVAAGGASALSFEDATPGPRPDDAPDAFALARAVRSRGGVVVATGGCFDLVHAGHVATLRGARSLGDCLIVCLNSDRSVRRLKGPGRPLVPEHDRAALLEALGCVDAVAIFDEDTPIPILERLEPDVFVKGGDYTADRLPEADVLARWGGQAVVLPYLDGRSTTRLIRAAVRRAGR